MTIVDPSPITCESCGYSLGGLASDGVCPECGTSIGDSARRIGSAWQRSQGLSRSLLEAVVSPRRMMRRLRSDGRRDWTLMVLCAGIAAAVPGMLIAASEDLRFMGGRSLSAGVYELQWLAASGVHWLGLTAAILLLTFVQLIPMRMLGAVRDAWKIGPLHAIYAHGNLGFLAGAAAAWVVIALIAAISKIPGVMHPRDTMKYATTVACAGLIVGFNWYIALTVVGFAVNRRAVGSSSAGTM